MTNDVDHRIGIDVFINYTNTRVIKSVICRRCGENLERSCFLRKMNPSYYCGHSFKAGEKVVCINLLGKHIHLCNGHKYQEMKDYLEIATLMGWDL